jgi:hypothetical protein
MRFPEWWRSVRGDRTQKEAAAAAGHGLTQSRISEIEDGLRIPSLAQLHAFMDACGAGLAERAAGKALWEAAELSRTTDAA